MQVGCGSARMRPSRFFTDARSQNTEGTKSRIKHQGSQYLILVGPFASPSLWRR